MDSLQQYIGKHFFFVGGGVDNRHVNKKQKNLKKDFAKEKGIDWFCRLAENSVMWNKNKLIEILHN